MLFKSLKGLKSFESEGHFQQLFTPVCPLPSGLGVVLCWSLHLGSILDQPCSCRRLDPEVKWGIPPTSVCAGPDLQGEPGVHVAPVSSENRNIWERREWLTGSVQQEESDSSLWTERSALLCAGANAHKIQLKTAGGGHSCCLIWPFSLPAYADAS